MRIRQKIKMKYLRSRAKGASFFFTVVTSKRKGFLCKDDVPNLIKWVFRYVMNSHPFTIDAFVLLPDHLHCIWTLPDGDGDFSMRWSLIKRIFTIRYNLKNSQKQVIWQKRFWEHQIRNDNDFIKHIEYIHYNPVKHGYTKSPSDWKWSSFHRYVRESSYDINWGCGAELKFEDNVGNE